MNRLSFYALAVLSFALMMQVTGAITSAAAPPKPNVVLIIVDELGYQFIGANGGLTKRGQPISTPNIDQLARSGIRWTHAHARAMCGLTRQTLMTGKHGFRYGTPPADMPFIANLIKNAGYATGHAGKWMMGPLFNPASKGYDEAAIYCGGYQCRARRAGFTKQQPGSPSSPIGLPAVRPVWSAMSPFV